MTGRWRPVLTAKVAWLPAQLALAASAVGLVVGSVLVATGEDSSASVSATTRSQVVTRVEALLTYRPATVLSDLESEEQLLTGEFAEEFTSQFRQSTGPDAQEGGISADAVVADVGVVSASAEKVTFLMFVNVAYTTAETTEASTRGSRLEVVAQKVDDEWRIAELRPL